MDDKLIIRLFFDRAESAIGALADKYGKRLYATALNILGSPEDAKECVNDTYLALWDTIPPQQPDPLCAYVYRIGRNTALKRLRDNSVQKRNNAYDLSIEELAECLGQSTMEEAIDARQLGQAINRFLAGQSRQNRTLFLRRYWFGDSVQTIARTYGMLPGAVSTRLSRIRAALATYLIQEGFL